MYLYKVLTHNYFYQLEDLCVLWLLHIQRSFGQHFGKELPTEREFGNFIDYYAVAVKKDSSDYAPLRFKNSFESDDPVGFIVKCSMYKYCMKNLVRSSKISQD